MVAIIVPVALFVAIAYAIVGVTRAIMDGRTRRKLLESNASADIVAKMVTPPRNDSPVSATLQWGLVLGAIGIALVIVQFLPYDEDDPILTGLVLIAAAIGLLGSHLAARRPPRVESGTSPMLGDGTASELLAPRTPTSVQR
jgi:hypothetical protein